MRCEQFVITAPGVEENNLKIGDGRRAEPRSPGQVLVDVAYGGCNFADTMIANGTYPHPKGYPLVGGLEISGRIATVGPGGWRFQGGRARRGVPGGGRRLRGSVRGSRGAADLDSPGHGSRHRRGVPDPGPHVLAPAPHRQRDTAGRHGPDTRDRVEELVPSTQMAVQAGATVIGTVGTKGKENGARSSLARREWLTARKRISSPPSRAFTKGGGVDKIVDSS